MTLSGRRFDRFLYHRNTCEITASFERDYVGMIWVCARGVDW